MTAKRLVLSHELLARTRWIQAEGQKLKSQKLPYKFFAVHCWIRSSALFRFSSELATLKRR
jgi:hypothetical protein